MLTWDQLTEISASGIECGGHSHTHPQLDTLPLGVARDEIVRCKRLLEHHLGQEVASFAYPYGYHTATIKRLVKEAGYISACAGKHVVCTETKDPFALTRFVIYVDTSVDALASLLTKGSPSAVITMYKEARIPMWRLARRFWVMLRRYPGTSKEGVLAR
jgi:peptidoglycan/xylan/chitin deacetylase (PgdA/CDA1 family)